MANFHTNLFVVAANEQDMLKVLRLCASNFLACADTAHFALGNFNQYERATALYRQLVGYLEGWYAYALSGVSGVVRGADGSDAGARPGMDTVTWGVNESGREALNSGTDKLTSYFAGLVGNQNIEISVSTAPTGGPLSDSADARLDEYAGTFVLSMKYSTAWEPNSGGVDAFFSLLEPGDYGVAFLDADEGDGYAEVSTFVGLHHGGCGLKELKSPKTDDYCDAMNLLHDAEKYVEVRREDIHDLVELAYAVAVCRWPEYESVQYSFALDEYYNNLSEDDEDDFDEWYEENYSEDIDFEEEYERYWGKGARVGAGSPGVLSGTSVSSTLTAKDIDWIAPKKADLKLVGELLAEMVQQFPVHAMLDDESSEVNQDAIASALAGDQVRIVSTWSGSDSEAPVDLTVESLDGIEFGHLGDMGYWSETSSIQETKALFATVACLLPHLAARVDKAMPIALRSGHARHSIFIVRIELAGGAYERIEEDARALLARPCSERNCSSLVKRG